MSSTGRHAPPHAGARAMRRRALLLLLLRCDALRRAGGAEGRPKAPLRWILISTPARAFACATTAPGDAPRQRRQPVTLAEVDRLKAEGAALIDVMPQRGGFDRKTGMWLIADRRETIPGAVWLPGNGRGTIEPRLANYLATWLRQLSGGKRDHPLVFFCMADCWMSWNAVRARPISAIAGSTGFRKAPTDGRKRAAPSCSRTRHRSHPSAQTLPEDAPCRSEGQFHARSARVPTLVEYGRTLSRRRSRGLRRPCERDAAPVTEDQDTGAGDRRCQGHRTGGGTPRHRGSQPVPIDASSRRTGLRSPSPPSA